MLIKKDYCSYAQRSISFGGHSEPQPLESMYGLGLGIWVFSDLRLRDLGFRDLRFRDLGFRDLGLGI